MKNRQKKVLEISELPTDNPWLQMLKACFVEYEMQEIVSELKSKKSLPFSRINYYANKLVEGVCFSAVAGKPILEEDRTVFSKELESMRYGEIHVFARRLVALTTRTVFELRKREQDRRSAEERKQAIIAVATFFRQVGRTVAHRQRSAPEQVVSMKHGSKEEKATKMVAHALRSIGKRREAEAQKSAKAYA